MLYCLYCHENKINHKKYVGVTCTKPEHRWGANGSGYKECPHFWHAIQKYGWDAFDHTILLTGQSKDEAFAKEVEFIKQWHLTDPAYGYNISKGGDGIDPSIAASQWQREGFKEYASECMKEAWKDPSKRLKRSEASYIRWTQESFREVAVKAINKACAKRIECIETGEVYDSIRDAASKLGVSDKNAQRAIKKGYRWGGFHWKYIDDIS